MSESSPTPGTSAHLDALLDRAAAVLDDPGSREGLMPEAASLRRLLELSRTMSRFERRDELLAYVRDRLREFFEAENAILVQVDAQGRYELVGEAPAEEEAFSRALLDRVVRERRPVLVSDTAEDPELQHRTSVHRLGIVAALCAPLIVDDKVIGVIQFEHRSRPSPFDERDLVLLHLFANQAATALENVLLAEARARAQDKLREAQAQLVTSETLRALGQMAAGVAHDFNNMLSSVLGLSELLLLNPELPATLRPDLETLKNCALGGAETVQRLQEFAGGAAGAMAREPVRLEQVVREVATLLVHRGQVGTAAHQIEVVAQDSPWVMAQGGELRDVVMNLALNGIEAMPEGGVLTVRVLARDGRGVVEVEDQGAGIDPEVRRRIFEPFFTTKAEGHGLGLSICWGIARRLGGQIDARPAAQQGTVFSLSLPAAPADAVEGAPRTPAAVEAHGAPASGQILLVDDDPMVRHVLGRMLEEGGNQVHEAGSGADALALLDDGLTPDLVVTDYGMPRMDGERLAQAVRERRPTLPVILITGWNPSGADGIGQCKDVTRVLRKPLTAEALLEATGEVMQASRA